MAFLSTYFFKGIGGAKLSGEQGAAGLERAESSRAELLMRTARAKPREGDEKKVVVVLEKAQSRAAHPRRTAAGWLGGSVSVRGGWSAGLRSGRGVARPGRL